MYLAYAEYTGMGGTLSLTEYTRFEFRARKEVDAYTFGRLTALAAQSESVKKLMFELVNIAQQSPDVTPQVTGETNDGLSLNFASFSQEQCALTTKRLVYEYLADEEVGGVPVLFKGVYA